MKTKKTTPPQSASSNAKKSRKAGAAPRAKPAPNSGKAPAKKLSALAAAAKVLGETGQAMTAPEMIEAMAAKGYWTSPKGKTPSSTLYASIIREVAVKGAAARFQKTERGRFALSTAQ